MSGLHPAALAVLPHLAAPDAEIAAETGMTRDAVALYRRRLIGAGEAARVRIDIHPLAEIFPAMAGADFDALVADIRKAGGVREKIVLHERRVVDGRNRFRALIAAGLMDNPVRVDALSKWFRHLRPEEGAPLDFVLSANLHRRHLTESQRALVAANLATLGVGRPASPPDNSANLHNFEMSISAEAAGEALHVSRRSVMTAKAVIEAGAPELVEAVRGGAVSLHAAETLAALPREEQAEIVARGKDEILRAAKAFRAEAQAEKAAKRAEKESALAEKIACGNAGLAAAGKKYGVILADPEWRFEPYSRETGMDRAPENHYPTSSLDAILARPVAEIAAKDCVLFLWATSPLLPEALAVMAAWGFAYKTHLVWVKDRLGTGYWLRSAHELLLIGTRGTVPAPAMGEQWASVLEAARGAHSAKPSQIYRLIEEYFPSLPKIELNARGQRPGWDVWGAEAPVPCEPEGV